MIIEQRNIDGSYHRWDFDKYVQVKLRLGDKVNGALEVHHPFLGKRFRQEEREVVFTKTVKHWYGGFYYLGVYEYNGSHGTAVIENINSISKVIIEQAEDFKTNYKPTDELVKS